MSKVVKQMQMDAIKAKFAGVRDMVVLSISKLSSQGEWALRANLRKKKIRLTGIKNSLTRLVLRDMGFNIPDDSPYWSGPTTIAYGEGSIAELSRNLDAELKGPKTAAQYRDRVIIKGAIADGQVVTYEQALKMPTRLEAIGNVLGMILSPGSRLASQLGGPGGRVASQIKEKGKEEGNPEGQ
jgi:ribosomal protein L10